METGYKFFTHWAACKNIQLSSGEDEYGTDMSCFNATEETIAEEYNPFDYYNEYVKDSIVLAILGKGQAYRCSGNFRLHTIFASLNPNNNKQLIKWTECFGLPSYQFPNYTFSNLHESYLPDKNFGILQFLKTLKDEITIYKMTVNLLNDEITDSFCANKLFREGLEALNRTRIDAIAFNPATETSLQPIKEAVEDFLNKQLEMISPQLRDNKIIWCFQTLLSAMYFMLALDRAKGQLPPRPCARESCNNYFQPTRDSARYCSPKCQKTDSQKHYMKQKREKEKIKKILLGTYKTAGRPKRVKEVDSNGSQN